MQRAGPDDRGGRNFLIAILVSCADQISAKDYMRSKQRRLAIQRHRLRTSMWPVETPMAKTTTTTITAPSRNQTIGIISVNGP
jgi:hypothetical protein